MKPKPPAQKNRQRDLFRVELEKIISPRHRLVKLSKAVDWDRLDAVFGATYCPDNGRPAVSTRLMVALHYLKYTYDLSDEGVVSGWLENPYWQYLSAMQWFEHEVPIHPSSMTRWRKRIGESGAEELLKATIDAGLKLKAVKAFQLKRVNVDTTVQEKEIRFPTDARLYNRARERLVKAASDRGIVLRQNYNRKAKQLLAQQSRYAHARQMRRATRCTRTLRTYLGRVIRDIERKHPNPDTELKELLDISKRIHKQKRHDKNKVYSVHAPEVECISKGKAHKRYEFGCKVAVAVTSKGGWIVGCRALHGNPYDGHTLDETLKKVHVDKRRRGRTSRSLWRWMKRRAAIEPGIGHMKQEHRMDRNRFKGEEGDKLNAILSAAGMNFAKLLKWLAVLLRPFFTSDIGCQRAIVFLCFS